MHTYNIAHLWFRTSQSDLCFLDAHNNINFHKKHSKINIFIFLQLIQQFFFSFLQGIP